MHKPYYRIEEELKYLSHPWTKDRCIDEGSKISAILTFFDGPYVKRISIIFEWIFDGDADDEGRPRDCSHWAPKLVGAVEDIQLFAEKHPDGFKQIPNEIIHSSDPDDVKYDLEHFFESLGIPAQN